MISTSKSEIFDTSSKPIFEEEIARETLISKSQLPPELINQRHIADQYKIVKFGVAANRPNGSTRTKSYFATDTNVLSMWNGSSWVGTTLS